jgi:hypothetical protein
VLVAESFVDAPERYVGDWAVTLRVIEGAPLATVPVVGSVGRFRTGDPDGAGSGGAQHYGCRYGNGYGGGGKIRIGTSHDLLLGGKRLNPDFVPRGADD